ncbi:zinc finger protein [Trichonephila inaurata madagascariensis]|uniref:Zinc finger protein n=1 Tax=Trichonephila inaurata madagascariensis TaxID=2747483 RepID=A0A8X6JJW3_9ARAC|nr:zinc finger protein [Trichonephila inaurata madagascariensis]
MDLDEDTHLCLRCGKTIEGLDNYVAHRQQLQCYKFQQALNSPFLSDTSESLASTEPQTHEFPPESRDIYKLSATDFFLSLNLQYNFKSSDSNADVHLESQKDSITTADSFCSKLDIPSFENEVDSAFPNDKPLGYDAIVDEHNCMDIENVNLSNEKWNDFKINNQFSHTCSKAESDSVTEQFSPQSNPSVNAHCTESFKLKETLPTDSLTVENKTLYKRSKKKNLKKYCYTNFSALNVPRTSYRQKLNANDSMMCCEGKETFYTCLFCNLKYSFASTYLDHILICSKRQNSIDVKEEELFKNEKLFVRSSYFKCLLCAFYCSDSIMFLNHLKSPNHRQNAAILKKPLICLPCQDECSASDEMREHFSKCHLQFKKGEHPIIIAEKKKNLHCCYCVTLVKSSSLLQSNDNENSIPKEDISFIRTILPNVCLCACGVDKHMLNTFLTNTSPFVSAHNSEVLDKEGKKGSGSDQEDKQRNEKPSIIMTFKVKDESKTIQATDEQQENGSPSKSDRQRIIAKITSKNGMFIYKKIRMSNARKTVSCHSCGAEYFSNLSLQSHMRLCKIIKQKEGQNSLFRSKNVNVESKLILKNRKFLCDKCPYIGKSFNQLTRHSRSHSGEKPYKCPYCSYSSSLSSQLVRHKRLHTGKKPYKCPYCSYMCNTQENLRKHILKIKKHKGKMMYPCQHCNYESNEFSDFKNHLLNRHSIQFPNGVTNCDSNAPSDENPGL